MTQEYNIPSLLRSIKVIEFIVEHDNKVTAAEIGEQLSIPKTTLFRILNTLIKENWVEKHGDKYAIGYRMLRLGMKTLSQMELRKVAIPYLEQLSEQLGETSHLAVLSEKKCLLLVVNAGSKHIRISARPGTLAEPHCCAVGKVLLAHVVGDNLDSFFDGPLGKRTPNTITDIQSLKEELKKIRQQGYSVDEREYYEDVRCIGAPVRNGDGKVIAAIAITAPAANLKKSMIKKVAPQVIEAADMISRCLGA